MESFRMLFGSLLTFVYHCFDRIVIQGYLPLLTRPEHIVHFFRDVHGIVPITKEVLIERTTEYKAWVEAFARDHGVPIAWAEAGGQERRPRPAVLRALRPPTPRGRVFHLSQHGARPQVSRAPAESGGPDVPADQADAQPVHAFLLLHS